MSSLPAVPVPLSFLPTFNFLQRLRIVYFHRLLVKRGNSSNTLLRIIAVTSSGDMGLFHIDGSRRGTLSLVNDLERVTFNHRYVMLEVAQGSDVEDDNGVLTLDFDTSSALVRGNETTDVAIKRFLHICSHFSRGISITRANTIEQQRRDSNKNFAKLVDDNDQDQHDDNNSILKSETGGTPKNSNTNTNSPGYSLRRKSAGSTFQKLFSGFSGVWRQDGSNNNNRSRGNSNISNPMNSNSNNNSSNNSPTRRNPGGVNFSSSDDDHDMTGSPNFNSRRALGGVHGVSSLYEQDADPNATVSVEYHGKQRKRLNRWREEILSRMGEREGVDAKERILDDLARLEGSLKKQQALIESPPPPSDEEELEQQRALAKLVMFICRRQSMLIEAKETVLPEIRPKNTPENYQVPTSVPVLPSYLDAFRSQFLG